MKRRSIKAGAKPENRQAGRALRGVQTKQQGKLSNQTKVLTAILPPRNQNSSTSTNTSQTLSFYSCHGYDTKCRLQSNLHRSFILFLFCNANKNIVAFLHFTR
jgi:hypothetical protein